MFINDHVSSNVDTADNLPCSHCHKPIVLLYRNGRPYRVNRVDCESNKLESYHLTCYDIILIGRVLTITIRKMREIEEEFGVA